MQATKEQIPNNKRLVIDIETTGLNEDDEILSLAIVDMDGNILWNKIYKPTTKTDWPEAQEVNGIAPANVVDAAAIANDIPELNKIITDANCIYIYNSDFVNPILKHAGIAISRTHDTMFSYTEHESDFSGWSGDPYEWHPPFIRLDVAARQTKYDTHPLPHTALDHARAIAHVQRWLDKRSE